VVESGPTALNAALAAAQAAAPDWARLPVEQRALCLERAADLLEERLWAFAALCCREAGKTVRDGLAEVREAADYCRYYAARARDLLAQPRLLPGPTGERNALALQGRGVFACIRWPGFWSGPAIWFPFHLIVHADPNGVE